ncbi:MAG: MFS transporter [Pseudoclavibacter sp.]
MTTSKSSSGDDLAPGTGGDAPANAAASDAPKPRILFVFIALMLSMLLASLNNTIISAATPTIVGELHGAEHISWVVTSFIMSSTVMMPVFGNLSDTLGRKPLLIIAISVFMLGSVGCALAWDINALIASRIVQGLGGGGLMILSQATIADVVPARERGQYMGVMGSVFAFSSVAGPLLGGWITDGPGWRYAFWLSVPLGILALLGTIIFLRLPKRPKVRGKSRVDFGGMMLLALGTSSLVLITTWGGSTYEWTSPIILGLIAVTVLTVVAFILVERHVSQPVIPLGMFRHRNFWLTTIASLALGVAMFGALGYMPTFLQVRTGLGASIAGLLMIPMMATMLTTGVIVGRTVTRTGRYKWAPITGSIIVAAALALFGTVQESTPIWLVCIYLGVLGLGIGVAMQILTLIVQNEFPNAMVGTATAANNYFRQVGATLGSAVVGAVFASRLTDILSNELPAGSSRGGGVSSLTPAVVWDMPESLREIVIAAYTDALMPIYLWVAPLMAFGFVATLFLREKQLATTVEREIPAEALATGQVRVVTPDRD